MIRAAVSIVSVLIIVVMVTWGLAGDHLRWVPKYNPSPSMPIGWYWLDRADGPVEGGIVLAHPPTETGRSPESTGRPLIKRVVGEPGDRIELIEGGVVIRNESGNHRFLYADGTGPYIRHPARIPPGYYYLMADHPLSWDSRYYGPVHESRIEGALTKL